MILSINTNMPIEDPVLKYLILLIIILAAPLLLNKIKVPHLIGLIIAGAIIGPNGLNILARDSNIVVTGTTGLLYIMFLAGIEIDMGDFKKNKWKSLGFGLYTFILPFCLGYISGYYLLGYNFLTSLLFASLFSSHTLISYPLLHKFGITKHRVVNVTVGGTMITDILALLVLAAVVGMSQGEANKEFWIRLGVSVLLFGLGVMIIFPIIGRWFFKNVSDKISQYIFVLVMIYLASLFAELAGVEAIIGAFLAGLSLNRLIPHTSSLMNRIEFVGNAIFIPFFLISVGMIIDFTVFVKSWNTILVAGIMLICSLGGKYIAAIASQKTFRWTKPEGGLIFGLSSASAAATLATVMVGYNVVLYENEFGEPIRLLNEHVLYGSILLILVSCTVSSFVTSGNAKKISETDNEETVSGNSHEEERILLALNDESIMEKIVNLSMIIKNKKNKENVYGLNIIIDEKNESSQKHAEKLLDTAVKNAASMDVELKPITRYDRDVVSGIKHVIKEKRITDLIIGVDPKRGFTPALSYNIYNGYIHNAHINFLIYHAVQPISTIRKHFVFISKKAEAQAGFFHALLRVWNIARNTGAQLKFYAFPSTVEVLHRILKKVNIEASIHTINSWKEVEKHSSSVSNDEGIILLMDRTEVGSARFTYILPETLNRQFSDMNYLIVYPFTETNMNLHEERSINNYSDYTQIGEIIGKIFK